MKEKNIKEYLIPKTSEANCDVFLYTIYNKTTNYFSIKEIKSKDFNKKEWLKTKPLPPTEIFYMYLRTN